MLKIITQYISLLFGKNIHLFGFIFRFLVRAASLYSYLRKKSECRLRRLKIREQSCLEQKRSIEFVGFEHELWCCSVKGLISG